VEPEMAFTDLNGYMDTAEDMIKYITREATAQLLSLRDRPTCILMPDDYSALGGMNARIKKTFKLSIFLSGFFGNAVIAVFLAWLGDKLGLPLYLAAVLVFGTRLFQNFAEIRRELTAEKLAYVNQLLSDYGLDKFRSAHPSELSGGMRQRAALIRTLALKPELLLLDEPFSALDSQTRLSVSDDIGRILHQEKKTAILVTHDISEAISMADRVIILSPRPAIIRKIVPVCFDLENRTPMASRNAPEFKSYFNLIWKELNHDV